MSIATHMSRHLDREHRLDFIPWPDTIDRRERRVKFGLVWKRGAPGPHDDSEPFHRSIGEGRRFGSERIKQAGGESCIVRMRRAYAQRPIFGFGQHRNPSPSRRRALLGVGDGLRF
jgi:hypothetical protein